MPQKVATAVYWLKSQAKSSCEHVGNRMFPPCLYLISVHDLMLVDTNVRLNFSFVNGVLDTASSLYVKSELKYKQKKQTPKSKTLQQWIC